MARSLLVLSLLAFSLHAQTPYLVKDLNTTAAGEAKSSSPLEFAALGNRIFFVAQTDETGQELWVADGTAAGATLVADIVPGNAGSQPFALRAVNGLLLFDAHDANHGIELWSSDGTAAGTHIVADINPGPTSSLPIPGINYKNGMLFTADDGTNGRELWFTDGTTAGTRLVKDITTGAGSSQAAYFFAFNNSVYFAIPGELWKTDGTTAGTVKVLSADARNFLPVGNRIFYESVVAGSGRELFVSDGTEAGSHLVTEINPGPANAFDGWDALGFTPFGNGVLFPANDGVHGRELWFSDGTAAGTRMVADVIPGSRGALDGLYGDVTASGNVAYFQGKDDDHGTELWVTDGTAAGTKLFADLNPGKASSEPVYLYASGGKLFFIAAATPYVYRLFVVDGGAAPHMLGDDLWPTLPQIKLWPIGSKVYFSGTDGLTGTEPWVSDGTDAGTRRLANLAADKAPSSGPRSFTAAGSTVLFTASGDDPAHSIQGGLWRSDGTAGGTFRLLGPDIYELKSLGSAATFTQSVNGAARTMMLTDGTIAGTRRFSEFLTRFGQSKVGQLYPFGDSLYVTATSTQIPYGDSESLWKTTIAPDAPAVELGSLNPYKPVSVAGRLYFFAAASFRDTYGRGLWTSDGTPAGTYGVIPQLTPDAYSLSDIVTLGGTIYFIAQRKDEKTKLWKSDGTLDGTAALKEFTSNSPFGTPIAAVGHHVYVVIDGVLWSSDGTEAGTIPLMTVKQGPGSTFRFFAAGERMLFDSYDYSDYNNVSHELWSTDGTVAGTKLILKQTQDPKLASIDGSIYFAGFDEAHGVELWTSDATAEGTKLLADINPGPQSSQPSGFTKAGNNIYFAAYTDSVGEELWALPLGDGTLSIDDARVAEGDSGNAVMHFRVTLSAPSSHPVTADYATADGSAQAGQDYDAASGTLTFAPGETAKTIDVRVHGDVALEGNETLFVRLSNGSARIVKNEGAGVIDDDDEQADVSIQPRFSTSSTTTGITLEVANNGPRSATNVNVKLIAPQRLADVCTPCSVPQLASGASAQLPLYFSYSASAASVISVAVSAHESDPHPENNSAAWLVGANNYMMMNAAYVTAGAPATVYGSSFSSGAVPVSSDPSVLAVSTTLTKLNEYVSSFSVTGVKPGTATITFGQSSLPVTVVAAGTTPRWPGAVEFSPGFTATSFDQALTITVTPSGRAPFTGATPTGTVRVTSGTTELARRTFTSSAPFSFPVYLPALGTNPYTITYDGDAVFLPQSTTATTFVRAGSATLLANLEPTNTPSVYRLTVTAAGSPMSPPSGTIAVVNGSIQVAKLALVPGADGKSTAQVTLTSNGAPPTLTLNYSGDEFYGAGSQQVRNVTPRQHAVRH